MGDPPPQDPYGPPPSPREQPPIGGWQPQQEWPQQPGQQPAEPYSGYADTHADYYRRQQEAAQQAAIGPKVPVNPLRNLGNWGMQPLQPGLSPDEQQVYDAGNRQDRRVILRFVILMAAVLIAGIFGLIRNLA
jgi:hypothetical protein